MEGDAGNNNDNTIHTRNASFSSYISRAEGNFMLKLSGSVQIQNPPPVMTLSRKSEEGEISVFGAERYVNMMLEDDGPRIKQYSTGKLGHNKKENRAGPLHMEPNIRPGTPSSCSEASWNSQSALLPSRLRNPYQSKKKKVIGKNKIFSSFSCNGSCSDKKLIHIHEINEGNRGRHEKDAKQPPPRFQAKDELHYKRSNEEEHFAQKLGAKSLLEEKKEKEEEPRKSLGVFGSNMIQGDMVAINLERRLSMLRWDAIPKAQSLSNTSETGGKIFEDGESDASSDLFEIENLPGNGEMLSSASRCESNETTMESRAVIAEVSDCDEKKVENGMHKNMPK